jgi:hypothetical protein
MLKRVCVTVGILSFTAVVTFGIYRAWGLWA